MTQKITQALHEVMGKCGYVQKRSRNNFHGYNYAGEADLLDVLRPAMLEAGLLLIPSGENFSGPDEHGNTYVRMSYTLAHKDGDVWPTPVVAFGCGNDKNSKGVGDKGLFKAITGANKYLLFKLFQIETGDDPERDENFEAPRETNAPDNKPEAPPASSKQGLLNRIETRETLQALDEFEAVKAVQEAIGRLPGEDQRAVKHALHKRREALTQERNLQAA